MGRGEMGNEGSKTKAPLRATGGAILIDMRESGLGPRANSQSVWRGILLVIGEEKSSVSEIIGTGCGMKNLLAQWYAERRYT